MLDIDGNSLWQFSTIDGSNKKINVLKYKMINSTTDMIVATSALSINRIVSSSVAPYSIVSSASKTFQSTTITN